MWLRFPGTISLKRINIVKKMMPCVSDKNPAGLASSAPQYLIITNRGEAITFHFAPASVVLPVTVLQYPVWRASTSL